MTKIKRQSDYVDHIDNGFGDEDVSPEPDLDRNDLFRKVFVPETSFESFFTLFQEHLWGRWGDICLEVRGPF